MRRVIESDVCIVGSGITAAMVAQKLAEQTDATITVVEAGDETPDRQERQTLRQRFLAYGESPWPNDHIEGMEVEGMQSRSMCVGGLAMHWGGVTPRFSPEDFHVNSLYGIGDDWPIDYDELDRYYQDAEERLGVAGEQGPPEYDPRVEPYPLPPLPLSYNLNRLQQWGADADIPFWSQPSAKNSVAYADRPACCRNDTCFPICPIGAKYSPDFTWDALRQRGRIDLRPRTVVRRLANFVGEDRIERAVALDRDTGTEVEFRARVFVVATGYVWSSHLLLMSWNGRFPDGLANKSGTVGKYVSGHRSVFAYVKMPMQLYPGLNTSHSLLSKKFQRPGQLERYVRHDLRIWESTVGQEPRLRNDDGTVMLGDELLKDWRGRTRGGVVRLRGYYDVLPARNSEITLDTNRDTPWGDPLPAIAFRDSDASRDLRYHTEGSITNLFRHMARVGNGDVVRSGASDFQDHPAGGCRMGTDPETSVVDSWGRAHDHENLFVVGAPTCVTGGCANGTLTFCALSLRSAEQIGRDLAGASGDAA